MNHLPKKLNYLIQVFRSNPSELLRILRIVLTSAKYRYLFRCTGNKTVVGEHTVFINSANIRIGDGCLVQDRVYFRAGLDGYIRIGDGAAVNSYVQIYGHGGIDIGDSAQIGPNTVVTTTGHDYLSSELDSNYAGIKIGKRAWIGANCTILPGVTIGDNAVIGAGAVVAGDIPANCVAVGVPARVVRRFSNIDDATKLHSRSGTENHKSEQDNNANR